MTYFWPRPTVMTGKLEMHRQRKLENSNRILWKHQEELENWVVNKWARLIVKCPPEGPSADSSAAVNLNNERCIPQGQ